MEESLTPGREPGSWQPKNRFTRFLDRYFCISERGSSILKECLGGLITFLAMFYILPLQASMLSNDWTSGLTGDTSNFRIVDGVRQILIHGDVWASVSEVYAGVFAATAISAAVTTLLMGIFGKLPVGLASALGPNSLIAFTVMLGMGFNFAESMAMTLISGFIFLIISITPLRAMILRNIPKSLKFAISAGIGFFIAFIGLVNMGIVKMNISSSPVALGDFSSPTVLLGLLGVVIVLVLASLPKENKVCFWISKFAIIISLVFMGILVSTLGTLGVGDVQGSFYNDSYEISEVGNIGLIFGSCFFGFTAFANPMAYALVFSLIFVDFFDTTGTLVGVESGAGLINEDGSCKVNDRPAMVVDAVGTCFGAVCGTTTVSSFVESTTGIEAGARTGLASVITGLLFALSLAVYPALAMFSNSAVTGLALVYVGVCMFTNLERLEWKDWVAVGSGFLTALVMTVSYSISDGIAFGFISYTIMTLAGRRFKKSDIPVACCAAAFIAIYIVNYTLLK